MNSKKVELEIVKLSSASSKWWDQRYAAEDGMLWGGGLNNTVKAIPQTIPKNSKILVIGFGYGRELIHLVKQGYDVHGIDFSKKAKEQTLVNLKKNGLKCNNLVTSKFEYQNTYKSNEFDFIIGHRALQLVIDTDIMKLWAEITYRLLKPNGVLLLSCRNKKDIESGLVKMNSENQYEHTNREGHLLSLWGRNEFNLYFSKYFEKISFQDYTETESMKVGAECNLTLMKAIKKSK